MNVLQNFIHNPALRTIFISKVNLLVSVTCYVYFCVHIIKYYTMSCIYSNSNHGCNYKVELKYLHGHNFYKVNWYTSLLLVHYSFAACMHATSTVHGCSVYTLHVLVYLDATLNATCMVEMACTALTVFYVRILPFFPLLSL